MRFTLRQIEVFLATAQLGTISRAAERLAMSQSAASGALQDFEQRYNTQLFDRIGKRLQLNAQGRELLPFAEALHSQADEVNSVLLQHEPSGLLQVGATLTVGNYVAIPILTRFKRDYPLIDARLHVANTVTIAQQVLNFELDIGLIEGEYAHPDLTVTPWRDDELVVFCAAEHAYAKYQELSDQQLAAAQWILRERGSGTRQTFDRAMQGLQNELRIFLELEHTEAIKRAVAAGSGLGCLSHIALQDEFAAGHLVPLAAPQRDFTRRFYRIVHAKKYQSKSLRRWSAYCDEYGDDYGTSQRAE